MPAQILSDVLYTAAVEKNRGLFLYPPGNIGNGNWMSYRELLRRAHNYSDLLQRIEGIRSRSIVLIHFHDHIDNIQWFWAAVIAGCVPTISTPFTSHGEQRQRHIEHLKTLLGHPICITRQSLLHEFEGGNDLNIRTVEEIRELRSSDSQQHKVDPDIARSEDIAMLMLTSGSTANAKAVCLTHAQVISAILGKSHGLGFKPGDTFLNWVGLDHVASLVESHIAAMYVQADQVLVSATDVLSDPDGFLRLLSKHKATFSFAPNFFLTRLKSAFDTIDGQILNLDFSHLRTIASGGEANVVEICDAINKMFRAHGAKRITVTPGFGMTETCAGAIYNTLGPRNDISLNRQFASLGICNPGTEMRITVQGEAGKMAATNEPGQLELCGVSVFKRYYNDPVSTAAAFTSDGWFVTGDRAYIDEAGHLNLAGRIKEVLNVNGVKHSPDGLETAIEDDRSIGITPNHTLAFAYRPQDSPTEQVCIVYAPTYEPHDITARINTKDRIEQITIMYMGVCPYVLPLDLSVLPRSTLGKLSRSKIQAAFGRGDFLTFQERNDELLRKSRSLTHDQPTNRTEQTILKECKLILSSCSQEIGVETSIFGAGITSINLLRLKKRLQIVLGFDEIPLITIMTNPTVRALTSAIDGLQNPHSYDPVVVLQSGGKKTPLWLIHPGVGEVLVFLALAEYFSDRPIYALRARGFDGEAYFSDITDATQTYHRAIKQRQPQGPYAIAGYSYGSMLAFEVSKAMKAEDDSEIKFLGSFNLPPHIKSRMEQLDWVEGILNLSYFLELITSSHARAISTAMHALSTKNEVVDAILADSDPARLECLGLTANKLSNWANLAHNLQSMARDYEPSGMVDSIDVFCAIPLAAVSSSKQEWKENSLSKWNDFSKTAPRIHDVDGEHYTMISPTHVVSFQSTLKRALEERGL
ncbi:thioesterase domain protein [Viridothelium virens]|uniref:Thioesterase domain protein n=1 Tax=Viridothelium virens TaxID=1048519 RepID=A0A6A6HEN5_VIRVR|nr:thioesterase domain protein [Viridothelium virens]